MSRQPEKSIRPEGREAVRTAAVPGVLRLHLTLQSTLEQLVPELADYAFVHLREPDGRAREVAILHRDREKEGLLGELLRRARERMTAPAGIVGRVLEEGMPLRTSPGATPSLSSILEDDERAREFLAELGPRHFAIVPLRTEDAVVGTLALARHETPTAYGRDDLQFIKLVANVGALAIENARIAERSSTPPAAPAGDDAGAREDGETEERAEAVETQPEEDAPIAGWEPVVKMVPEPAAEEEEEGEEPEEETAEGEEEEAEAPEPASGPPEPREPEDLPRPPDPTQGLLESLPEAVAAIDLDGRITFWNRAASALTGLSREEVVGEGIQTVIRAEMPRSRVREAFRRIKEGRAWSGPVEISVRGGRSIPILLSAAAVGTREGRRTGLVAVARDREEDADAPTRGEMLGALASFLGGVAHTLNNRLTAIRGEAEVTLMELPRDHEIRPTLEQITESADQAATIIRQLLAYSRRQVLRPSAVDLNEFLERTRESLAEVTGEGREVVLDLQADPATVKIDPRQLEVVLRVLASNARHAMPGGGEVTLSTRTTTLTPEETAGYPYPVRPGRYVVVTVRDSGFGVEPELEDRIFEPFFTTRASEGALGLGLSAAYGIVKQSDGYIWLDSSPGEGAAFHLFFPEYDNGEDGATEEDEGRKVVLVVEDQEESAERCLELLPELGFRVVRAEHGSAALRLWAELEGQIDLVLVQMDSKSLGGKLLVDRLKTIRPDIPLLYTSHHVDGPGAFRGLLRENEEFLKKPFTDDELAHKVRSLVEKSSGGPEQAE